MVMLKWYSLLISYELHELLEMYIVCGPCFNKHSVGAINQNQNNRDFSTCICETKRCIQLSGCVKTDLLFIHALIHLINVHEVSISGQATLCLLMSNFQISLIPFLDPKKNY